MRRVIALLVLFLSACGGGGGVTAPPPPPPPPPPPDIGGIWQGPNTVGGQINSIVDENGVFYVVSTDPNGCNTFIEGKLQTTGNNFSTQNGYVGLTPGCAFSDGGIGGSVVISGTFSEHQSLDATSVVITTELGTVLPATQLTLSYNSLYSEPSATTKLAGNWSDGAATLSINSDGSFFEQDGNGCVLNGNFMAENSFNVYTVAMSFNNCPNVPNGFTMNGLATLNDQISPVQIDFGLSATIGKGNGFVAVFIAGDLVHQ